MLVAPAVSRLLAGPPLDRGMEPLDGHVARLGGLPDATAVRTLIDTLETSGLTGRGGAGFPVGRKWRSIAQRSEGRAVVVANGAEGEPASAKDRTLMAARPHLVLDGAVLAAEAIGADDIVVYVGREHLAAIASMAWAVETRRASIRPAVRIVQAPLGYVAGEATAAVHYINDGDARPMSTPPRMSASGVAGRPTLVQNVETLAHVALIARFGAEWYRSIGRHGAVGSALVTITGAVGQPGVREIELGTTLGELVAEAGGLTSGVRAIVLGGYFGTWARPGAIWELPLDPVAMGTVGLTFGCGIVGLLPQGACGVRATATIMRFMSGESAGQCGPCVLGLGAIADATARIARGAGAGSDLAGLHRWVDRMAGRGACRHPDGAVQLMRAALDVFDDDFADHVLTGRCGEASQTLEVA
jgi:NADH:ubiquinone oxidoreductase subunit F (NADH-binding)